jgi:replicative DNA helicase
VRNLEALKIDQDWPAFLKFRDRRLVGVQTGINALDKSILGLSGIVVIQGAPGCNKSTLALQVAQYQATLGNPSLIIDRENGRERFRMRLLCMANRVSTTDVLTSPIEVLRKWVAAVTHYPIYVETEPVKTYEEIKDALEQLWNRHGERPMLLVVDSLQALPPIGPDERTSIQTWLGHFDQLKLTYEGKLTIIVTSEKTRGQAGANYDVAILGAGKGSGAVEYKAEIVLDLRRDQATGGIICEVLKHRDGQSGVAIPLVPVLADLSNPQSFCFRLAGEEKL